MDWKEDLASNLWVFPAGVSWRLDGGRAEHLLHDLTHRGRPEKPDLLFRLGHAPNTFWIALAKTDLKPGSPVKKLTISNGEVSSGEVSGQFEKAEPFKFLPAKPPAN